MPTADGNSWYAGVMGAPPVTVEVQTITLDDYVAANPERLPSVVKIDVEGAETKVIEGMSNTIEKCHPAVIIDGTRLDAAKALVERGYSIIDLMDNREFDVESGEKVPFTTIAVYKGGRVETAGR